MANIHPSLGQDDIRGVFEVFGEITLMVMPTLAIVSCPSPPPLLSSGLHTHLFYFSLVLFAERTSPAHPSPPLVIHNFQFFHASTSLAVIHPPSSGPYCIRMLTCLRWLCMPRVHTKRPLSLCLSYSKPHLAVCLCRLTADTAPWLLLDRLRHRERGRHSNRAYGDRGTSATTALSVCAVYCVAGVPTSPRRSC